MHVCSCWTRCSNSLVQKLHHLQVLINSTSVPATPLVHNEVLFIVEVREKHVKCGIVYGISMEFLQCYNYIISITLSVLVAV